MNDRNGTSDPLSSLIEKWSRRDRPSPLREARVKFVNDRALGPQLDWRPEAPSPSELFGRLVDQMELGRPIKADLHSASQLIGSNLPQLVKRSSGGSLPIPGGFRLHLKAETAGRSVIPFSEFLFGKGRTIGDSRLVFTELDIHWNSDPREAFTVYWPSRVGIALWEKDTQTAFYFCRDLLSDPTNPVGKYGPVSRLVFVDDLNRADFTRYPWKGGKLSDLPRMTFEPGEPIDLKKGIVSAPPPPSDRIPSSPVTTDPDFSDRDDPFAGHNLLSSESMERLLQGAEISYTGTFDVSYPEEQGGWHALVKGLLIDLRPEDHSNTADILGIYDRGFGSGDEEEPLEINSEDYGKFRRLDGNSMETTEIEDRIMDISFTGRGGKMSASFTWSRKAGGWRRVK